MDHIYKNQLQSYAMKRNMELPVYAAEREGPAHAPRFRCKVTVCGQTFQSHEFFPTLKAAEHGAAKLAMASLAPLSPEGIDGAYKNLLQEIAQKESSLLPVYATAASGPSHSRTFVSTVEFAGKVFQGEEAKTKKLAEMSAAKVAFMSIKYGHQDQTSSTSANLNSKSSLPEIPSQPSKMVTPDVPSKWIEVYEDELDDVCNAKEMNIAASHVPVNPTNDGTLNAPADHAKEINVSVSHVLQNPTNECSYETFSYVEESEKDKLVMGTGHMNIPSGQRVVCRPWKPEMTLPQDAEMLFRDDRFIAYRLVNP